MPIVQIAAGAAALGLIGYGVYKAYQAITHHQHAEEVKEEGLHTGDAGIP